MDSQQGKDGEMEYKTYFYPWFLNQEYSLSGELEDKYISRCISEIGNEYDVEGQAYAICKGEFDKLSLAVEDTSELIEPKPNEGREQYIRRCVPTIYKPGGEYDQRIATAMCADRYENSNTLLNKQLDSFSSVARKIKLYFN
jgi:hypothetical protein